ncbi:DUF6397 family protein [Streptomyces sp. NBC_01803]|uniref:DUF6397 family protein n=1 Tax=Streptomyces sp. NBC_01803 TaxID=2975946 RepID=UPI002DD98C04|nr:DUF6397 family protein [Streptomyces sp. NBC_01803]WSA42912.1 DUF6397 family protein [Streptomyces sp. NBC_01803]
MPVRDTADRLTTTLAVTATGATTAATGATGPTGATTAVTATDATDAITSDTAAVPVRRAAKELGLGPREFGDAVRLDHIPTVATGVPWQRSVPRAALDRLRADRRFPEQVRDLALMVNATGGAELLGIAPSRFSRLARGGLLAPVDLHVNRHRVVVWRYAAAELRAFAAERAELLTGPAPEGLRRALRGGEDWRPRRWRRRRADLLTRQAEGPWQRAAALAAVLEPPTLAADVPDARERALLLRLRPPLAGVRSGGPRWDIVAPLLTATDPDEARWYRAELSTALIRARAAAPVAEG